MFGHKSHVDFVVATLINKGCEHFRGHAKGHCIETGRKFQNPDGAYNEACVPCILWHAWELDEVEKRAVE